MSIENAIKGVIADKLEEGIIERLVAENLEKGINKALESLLSGYGDVTRIIQDKIKEVMVEQLEGYDYSQYLVKLDSVLTEILKSTALDNAKILKNFERLMSGKDIPKTVKLSDIFEQFNQYASKNVDTSNLEVNYDDGVSYEHLHTTMEVEQEDRRSWSSFENATVTFECEQDQELNILFRLTKFKDEPWKLSPLEFDTSIKSLRYLNELKIYLLELRQNDISIEIDDQYLEENVAVEAEPEASFS